MNNDLKNINLRLITFLPDYLISSLNNNRSFLLDFNSKSELIKLEHFLINNNFKSAHKFIYYLRIVLDNINSILNINIEFFNILHNYSDILNSLFILENEYITRIFESEKYIFDCNSYKLLKLIQNSSVNMLATNELMQMYREKEEPVPEIQFDLIEPPTLNHKFPIAINQNNINYDLFELIFSKTLFVKQIEPNISKSIFIKFLSNNAYSHLTNKKNNIPDTNTTIANSSKLNEYSNEQNVSDIKNHELRIIEETVNNQNFKTSKLIKYLICETDAENYLFPISSIERVIKINTKNLSEIDSNHYIYINGFKIKLIDNSLLYNHNIKNHININSKCIIFKNKNRYYGMIFLGNIRFYDFNSSRLETSEKTYIAYEIKYKKTNYVVDIETIMKTVN